MKQRSAESQESGGVLEPLATKLRAPKPPPGGITNQRLARTFEEGSEKRLTVVTAPAGYGKTTVVAGWFHEVASESDLVAGWLSLDASENDPPLLLRYIVAALRAGGSHAGERTEAVLGTPGVDVQQALTWLINDLAAASTETVLVFEDYHVISEPKCHEIVATLIERAPPNLRVVIASRTEPPLPLGSLRATGQLAELAQRDLRLTEEEAGQFLESEGFELERDDLAMIVAKTEGWVAALQLAALWLRDQDDIRGAIRSFAGDHRHLVDYLGEQVLANLDPEIEDFLLKTSILGRFCAALCDAVTGVDNASDSISQAADANLFIVSLDDRREWYRYHHLFGGLLQAELQRRGPDAVSELHRRAYLWHAEHGTPGEAVRHAMLAGDAEAAANIITRYWVPALRSGRAGTLLRWAAKFSPSEAARFPQVAYAAGLSAGVEGRAESTVEAWLRIAEEAITAGTAPSGPMIDGSASFSSNVDVLRAAFVYRDVGEAVAAARRVLSAEPDQSPWILPATAALGFLLYLAGEREEAGSALSSAISHRNASHQPHGLIHALGTSALLQLDDGDPVAAQRSALRALEVARRFGLSASVTTALAHVALGRSLEASGRVAESLRELESATDTLGGSAPRAHDVYARLTLAEAQRASGDLVAAHRSADEAETLLEPFTDAGILSEMLESFRRRSVAERRRRSASPDTDLTETELSLLRLLSGSGTQREIAAQMSVSHNTVKTHTQSIYRKLAVGSRSDALARARELELL
jgi:LuxR family maltose regulon positive regulatory protein